ncbi:aminotransferase class I/II-fold pyridoxal phosphate-dependent enzyme [Ornithinimicrobium humiphilum]|uniref:cysteine-S-conjugate beta-lyase n=1 Tax=Ornithinimicrobium humiphilum TaxID=125288 RepID=A0A543K6T4_9MICO|nr:aminotransferase class I/II-fold pyridoxal phosphate-dependent enzyme [Ornithinimicrobium humiphilum]TQM90781.1 cystathionine beta-lyase [Ornithinimicrobium humiphilum]
MTAPFDLTLDDMLEHRSAKWSRVPDGVLPAWTAEMDVRTAPAIAEALQLAVRRSDFGYAGDPAPVARAFAGFARDVWDWETEGTGGQTRLFADVGHGVKEVLRSLTRPGDRVVLNPPVYLSFYPWLRSLGLEAHEVPMLDVASGGRLDLEGMEHALAEGTRVVLLCSPHNPLGHVYPREDLAALAELALAHDAVVVADEIHAPLVHPGGPRFVPWLTVSDAARQVGIALHSPSKAWNTAGLKLALGVTAVPGRWPADIPAEVDWAPSILGQYAAEAAYTDGLEWLDTVRTALEERTAQLADLLERELPQVRYAPGSASYLAWLDCRELGLGDDPARVFLERGRVMLSPGPAFGSGGAGFARLNIGTSEELMTEAVRRMRSALD